MSNIELKKILYAEDELDIRSIAKIALEDIGGFNVMYCATGQEALNAAKNFDPDLLLFDVMMPVMDGPSALIALRKIPTFANKPAVFMTAKIQTEEIEGYKAMGVIEVINKPFDPMTLSETIKKAWEKYYGY